MPLPPPTETDILAVAEIAVAAGQKIMEFYGGFDIAPTIELKADDSPVTVADRAAHDVIWQGLEALGYGFPILSEEGRAIPYAERQGWETFWLVDPLDGTKEFIRRTGSFAVNIGLVHQGYAVAGAIYQPVSQQLYYADHRGTYRRTPQGRTERLVLPAQPNLAHLRAVRSKGNFTPAEQQSLDRLGVATTEPVGSALKYCLLAEGLADIYYRTSPNSEWDSAAGQAIIEHAGGRVLALEPGFPRFGYNKPSLINGGFICTGFAETNELTARLGI
jgi:3'(2'), 5'-bisphosphate nucleotidase